MGEHGQIDFEGELRRQRNADPFTPFEIVVSSGNRYPVNEREQLAFGGNMVVVLLPKTGMRYFRKNQIVAVHVHEPAG